MHVCLHTYICPTGVFFRTIKSLIHALGINPQMTESTINSTLYIFIEQVNNSHLQKMALQSTTPICIQYGLHPV